MSITNTKGEILWSFIRGSDLAKIFNNAIKYTNGLFKTSQQSEFVNSVISLHGICFSCEVNESQLEELDLSPLKHQYMVIIGGRYKPNKITSPIPICYVYIVDHLGPAEKYKCRFTSKSNKKRLCDYELKDIELVWQRSEPK